MQKIPPFYGICKERARANFAPNALVYQWLAPWHGRIEAEHRARLAREARLGARADAAAIEAEIMIFPARWIITIDWATGEIALFEDNEIPLMRFSDWS